MASVMSNAMATVSVSVRMAEGRRDVVVLCRTGRVAVM